MKIRKKFYLAFIGTIICKAALGTSLSSTNQFYIAHEAHVNWLVQLPGKRRFNLEQMMLEIFNRDLFSDDVTILHRDSVQIHKIVDEGVEISPLLD